MGTKKQDQALQNYQRRFVQHTFGGDEPPEEVVEDIRRIVASRKKQEVDESRPLPASD